MEDRQLSTIKKDKVRFLSPGKRCYRNIPTHQFCECKIVWKVEKEENQYGKACEGYKWVSLSFLLNFLCERIQRDGLSDLFNSINVK